MAELRFSKQEDTLTICLEGHISSANAPDIEAAVLQILKENPAGSLVLDCEKLEYISSAGLRVLLRLKKSIPDMTLIQVSPDVYEIFEMTGFCEILTVRKGYRMVSLDGCPVIGKGANGEVRRLNPGTGTGADCFRTRHPYRHSLRYCSNSGRRIRLRF